MSTKHFLDECHTKWGKHPKQTQSLKHLNGIITAINDDGTYEVDFHHPRDKGVFNMDSHSTMTVECTNWGFTDAQKESNIKRFHKTAFVGKKVSVNEYHNLFYIYIWERKFRYGEFKMQFKCGEPHNGYKIEYRIDAE